MCIRSRVIKDKSPIRRATNFWGFDQTVDTPCIGFIVKDANHDDVDGNWEKGFPLAMPCFGFRTCGSTAVKSQVTSDVR